jgi:hypothetical protein
VASPAHRQRSGGRTLRSWIGPWIVIDYVSAEKDLALTSGAGQG